MDIFNSRIVDTMRELSEVQRDMSENQRRLADALLRTLKEVERQKNITGGLITIADTVTDRLIMSETAIAMLISLVEDYDTELKNLRSRVKVLEAKGGY